MRKQKIVVDDLFTMSKTANYWYKGGYNPVAVVATVVGAILAMAPVLLGGIVFGMAGASQYSWFIGCGVAFAPLLRAGHARPVADDGAAGRRRRHARRPN